MENLKPKRVSESKARQVQFIMAEHINGYNRLFGGQLVEWIDIVAGVVARRHCNHNITTVFIDNLHFKSPAHMNDLIVLEGQITYVGSTSMEVRVDSFVEDINGGKQLINRAYFVLVALDENENPIKVPSLILETEEDKLEWEAGKKRNALRKQRTLEQF